MRHPPALIAITVAVDAFVLSALALWTPHCTYPEILRSPSLTDVALALTLPAIPLAALVFVSTHPAIFPSSVLRVISLAASLALAALVLTSAAVLLSTHSGTFCIPVN